MINKIFSKIFGEVKIFPETLQPIMWLGRLMGFSVIEYPIGHPWFKLSIINSFIRFVLYGCLLYYAESHISRNSTLVLGTSFKVYYLIRFINIGLVVATAVLNIYAHRGKSLHIKKMTMTDAILKEFGIDSEYSNERRRNLYICLIWCSWAVIINVTAFLAVKHIYNSKFESFIKSFVYSIPVSISILIQVKIGEHISIVARRFERLNALTHRIVESTRGTEITKNVNKYHRILQRNHKRNESEDSNIKYKDNIVVVLKTVRQLHLYLCMTAREMLEMYGTEILFYLTSTFILFTGFSYITYLVYNESTLPSIVRMYHFSFLWFLIIISLSTVIFLIHSTVSVMDEAKKTSHVAYEIQSVDQEVLNEIHQLSLQSMQHPLHLTASGFFVLDFVYVRGFIGSAATYFMILIQNKAEN